MAYIQKIKRKKGVAYQVEYWRNGKRFKQYFPAGTDKKIIQAFVVQGKADKLKESLNKNTAGVELFNDVPLTLSEFKQKYIESRRHEIQIWRHELTLKKLLKYFGLSIRINNITADLLNKYKNDLLEQKFQQYNKDKFQEEQRARRGVNKELSNIRTIFLWAYHKNLIKKNPFEQIKLFKTSQPLIHIPTASEERRFRKQLRSRDAKLSYFIIRFTGLRRSEIRELRYHNMDLKNKCIYIEKQKNRKPAILPIHPVLFRLLRRYKIQGPPDEKIFNYNKDYLTGTFRRALDRVGLKHIKNPAHVFRHAFVTNLLKSTRDLALVRDLARHADFNTTKKYLHLLPEDHLKLFESSKL